MANPNCIRCQHTTFELKEVSSIASTDYPWNLLQCAKCGGVVGVLDHFAIGNTLTRIEGRVEAIAKAMKVRI